MKGRTRLPRERASGLLSVPLVTDTLTRVRSVFTKAWKLSEWRFVGSRDATRGSLPLSAETGRSSLELLVFVTDSVVVNFQ